jgi:hypothetical protein
MGLLAGKRLDGLNALFLATTVAPSVTGEEVPRRTGAIGLTRTLPSLSMQLTTEKITI